ncbi:hypothetical protein DFQ29_007234 [Apophysomyces sp. BC1021]|nr:hypothetical protein DFQ29_007234 [Apophysomyces sp. BC1021]
MSDVHGVKRVRTTEEAIKARRQREAGKIEEYNKLVTQCHEKVQAQEYSTEALVITTRILESNPDYYTIWNLRRRILINGILKTTDEKRPVFVKELQLFMQLIQINPKSYWLWNHRRWCLETMPDPDWTGELGLVNKMLTMDGRNFHGWDYRRYVVGHLRAIAGSPEKEALIVQQEYDFTTQKINQSFSNYSAWHQRSKLLSEIVADMSTEEKNQVAKDELDFIKNAIYTDPNDQSAWLYYWWLVGKAPEHVSLLGAFCVEGSNVVVVGFDDVITLVKSPLMTDSDGILDRMKSYEERFIAGTDIWKPLQGRHYTDPSTSDRESWYTLNRVELLKEEIQAVRDLLDLEPESKWTLQTLAHFLQQLKLRLNGQDADKLDDETINIFEKLSALDACRASRYEEARSRIMFERATRPLLRTEENGEKVLVTTRFDSLDLSQCAIPIPASILLVRRLAMQPSETTLSTLDQLPFLEECTQVL